MKKSTAGHGRSAALYLIGVYKLFEGVLLFVAAIGALRLLHRDLAASAMHWIHILRLDPDNHYIHKLLVKIFAVTPRQLELMSAGTFFYATLRLIEGVGLMMRKRWAEYLVVIATAIFIPLEIYELIRRFTMIRLGLLMLNVLIVVYLASNLRKKAGGFPKRRR